MNKKTSEKAVKKGNKIKVQTPKGFRDFLPGEMAKRNYVLDTLKGTFESFGFEPLETPTLEYEEVLTGKYGREGDKLMYRFTDNGGRRVALRYDQTVPLARVISQYKGKLPMPFKRYQIQNVFRADKPQKGRYREFMQCDIDTIASPSPVADAEVISCALYALKKLGFKKASMRINDRNIFKNFGLSSKAIMALDKIDKQTESVFMNQLIKEGKTPQEAETVFSSIMGLDKPQSIKELFSLLEGFSLKEGRGKDFYFDPTLARGLDYYTGFIFELEAEGYGRLMLGGGGRYDRLIGMFSGQDIPATGFAFGFDRLCEVTEILGLFPEQLSTTKVLLTQFSEELSSYSIKIAQTLREAGVNVDLYPSSKTKLDKQLKYADKKNIPYVLIAGPKEADKNTVTVKNLKTKTQKEIPLKKLKEFNF